MKRRLIIGAVILTIVAIFLYLNFFLNSNNTKTREQSINNKNLNQNIFMNELKIKLKK